MRRIVAAVVLGLVLLGALLVIAPARRVLELLLPVTGLPWTLVPVGSSPVAWTALDVAGTLLNVVLVTLVARRLSRR